MSIEDIGTALVEACNQGRAIEAVQAFYADSVVSVEGLNTPGEPRMEGKQQVLEKNRWYYDNHTVHNIVAYGPFVPSEGNVFSVYFDIDVTQNWSDERVRMREVALYRVSEDKIYEETFMFHPEEI